MKGQLDDCSFGVTGKSQYESSHRPIAHQLAMMCPSMASLYLGLKLQGAQCVRNVLSLTATILTELPLTSLQWVRVKPTEMQGMAKGKVSQLYAVIHFPYLRCKLP